VINFRFLPNIWGSKIAPTNGSYAQDTAGTAVADQCRHFLIYYAMFVCLFVCLLILYPDRVVGARGKRSLALMPSRATRSTLESTRIFKVLPNV